MLEGSIYAMVNNDNDNDTLSCGLLHTMRTVQFRLEISSVVFYTQTRYEFLQSDILGFVEKITKSMLTILLLFLTLPTLEAMSTQMINILVKRFEYTYRTNASLFNINNSTRVSETYSETIKRA